MAKDASVFKSNSMYPGLSEKTSTETIITGVAPAKMDAYFFHCHCSQSEGSEMSFGEENGGCKCGSNCTCDPCSCKSAKMDKGSKEASVAVKL
ncbi:metallothionein-like protein 1 [Quercus suber]|uniref:metallothionein-like protein 1 n=1 Tax=Quercus suber TaxID=58331 RepID=UPI0032DFECB3